MDDVFFVFRSLASCDFFIKLNKFKHIVKFYLNLRFLAASDFFLRLTLGFS